MTYKSTTAYRGQAVTTKAGSGVINARSKAGKDWFFHQLMAAYGDENVLLVNNGGPLDSIIPYNPMIENARNYEEIGILAKLLDDKVAANQDLPFILYHEDLTNFGNIVEARWGDERLLKSKGEKDRSIERYNKVKIDGLRYINRFNILPLINIYCITESLPTKDNAMGKMMFPGSAFLNELVRKVGFIVTLRRFTDDSKEGGKHYRCQFDTLGRGGEFGGDRTGVLQPIEPPDLPDILRRLYGLEPIHKYTVAIDGEVKRNENQDSV